MPMTSSRPFPTLRHWLLIGAAALWLVLAAIWFAADPGGAARTTWLTLAVAVLPLLIAYELSTMALRWVRRRRDLGQGRGDA